MTQAKNLADFEGFVKLIETSSLFGEGVKNVFDEAVYQVLKGNTKYGGSGHAGGGGNQGNRGKKNQQGDDDKDKKCIIY